MKFKRCIWLLLIVILVAACGGENGPTDSETTQIIPRPTLDFNLAPSEAALTGQVLDRQNQPMATVEVRLAQIFWDENRTTGAYVIEGGSSPTTLTTEDGRFLFRNLEPFDYAIVVGDLFGQHIVIANEDDSAKIFTVEKDALIDVGMLQVDLDTAPVVPVLPTPVDAPYPGPLPTPADNTAYP